ncbi:hypothetical protein J437_LFUL001006 [Ladona fulva]|uniref:DDE-1 domain-containing protein n=1 Tax=Ladona fulva TaxID=123851 RepID=A0A8K0KH44_LADFU|nr:hypothetical protein J437_LFUL001006 [Ladona fulva]
MQMQEKHLKNIREVLLRELRTPAEKLIQVDYEMKNGKICRKREGKEAWMLRYRKLLLTSNLNDPVHNDNLENALKKVNLKDVVFILAKCWASVSTLLIKKSWKNLLPNYFDSEVEENVQTAEIQLTPLINQLRNLNPISNPEALQWAAKRNFNRRQNYQDVSAEDDDDDDDTPVNSVKISHSEAVAN